MRWIILFLLTTHHLFANIATTENEPSAIVDGIVSAVTGELYLFEEDIVVQGYEPIRLKRNRVGRQSNWAFFAHLQAREVVGSPVLIIPESNGTELEYSCNLEEFVRYQTRKQKEIPIFYVRGADGLTNTSHGAISAATNLKNQYAVFRGEFGKGHYLDVYCANGGKRVYELRYSKKLKFDDETHHLLIKEELPNGNIINYAWNHDSPDKKPRLSNICSQSPLGKIYASISFRYVGNQVYATTSDGRKLSYRYEHDNKDRSYLTQVDTQGAPQTTFSHIKRDHGYLVSGITHPDKRSVHVTYHDEGDNRVKTLRVDGEKSTTKEFIYQLGKSTVLDSNGEPTHYYWDRKLRLIKIEAPHQTKTFQWSPAGSLLTKSILDKDGHSLIATHYTYDERGNILEERIESDEVYTKRYTYSDNNLLLSQTEDNGLTITYEYLPGTNLPTKIQTGERTTTYEYDRAHVLTRIVEEGSGTRRIQRFIPNTEHPYAGLPKTILKLYGDDEKLLKRYDLHYTTGGRISQKDVYDTDNNFCFSLIYKYDEKGHLIEKTNSLGQNVLGQVAKDAKQPDHTQDGSFIYNADGTLRSHTDLAGIETIYAYDMYGRVTFKSRGDAEEYWIYDAYNLLSHIDAEGHHTDYTYDAAGRKIAETIDGERKEYTYDSLGHLHTKEGEAVATHDPYYNLWIEL